METKKEKFIIRAGTMVNCGLHEDDDYFIAQKDLVARVIRHLPGAVQVIIPQLVEEFFTKFNLENMAIKDETFFIHQPD